MVIDRLIEQILHKQNPGIVGIDPDLDKIPRCFKKDAITPADVITRWATEVIDCIADIVPAVKPQTAFFEIFGAEGFRTLETVCTHARSRALTIINDCKRGDIGSTARAYAQAYLAPNSTVNADFITISPFLGPDSMQPFIDAAARWGKGLFVLVKTSNPGSVEISEAAHHSGQTVCRWLGEYVNDVGRNLIGAHGYASIGAVVGATFPEEAAMLRRLMPKSFFLVPGYGAQGGNAADTLPCFNTDDLGAVVNSSRGILYPKGADHCNTKYEYLDLVRAQALAMRHGIQTALHSAR